MAESNVDLFDPHKMTEEYLLAKNHGQSSESDFGFAFNDSNFSDRLLRIEVLPDFPEIKSDSEGCIGTSIVNWARNRKRRRHDIGKHADAKEPAAYENQEEELVAMVEESPLGEVADGNNSSCSMNCSKVLRVRTIYISSPILAAKSPFFYKLFSSGMRESEQQSVTLQVHASEEAALIDLLNFMYSNTLSSATPSAILDVLMVADKFEVASCMRYCSRMLRTIPMTCESALLFLDLPSSVLITDAVRPLTDAAKQFLASRYKDINKFSHEVLKLPLAGLEAVLSSDDLQVDSEDAVYDFVLNWAKIHYPKIEERRVVIGSRLVRLIRFQYMTCPKLKKVLMCIDFDPNLASKIVLEALFYKAEAPSRKWSPAADETSPSYRHFVERAYKFRPVKVVEFEFPRPQCVVYLDLKKEECANLFPAGRVYSQSFDLDGQRFLLLGHCNMDQQSSLHCFGLFLGMRVKGTVPFAVDCEVATRSKPTEEYISKYKGNYNFTGGRALPLLNLFSIPWTTFMDEDSHYFIKGILYLKANITIRQ